MKKISKHANYIRTSTKSKQIDFGSISINNGSKCVFFLPHSDSNVAQREIFNFVWNWARTATLNLRVKVNCFNIMGENLWYYGYSDMRHGNVFLLNWTVKCIQIFNYILHSLYCHGFSKKRE